MAKVKIYNRGKRTWDLKNGIDKDKKAIMVKLHPGQFKDFDKSAAEKLIKNYPKDFIMADDAPGSSDSDILVNPVRSKLFHREVLAEVLGEVAAHNHTCPEIRLGFQRAVRQIPPVDGMPAKEIAQREWTGQLLLTLIVHQFEPQQLLGLAHRQPAVPVAQTAA